jgi:uncharacterized protein YaaN involved in tellurite resistance
MIDPNFDPLSIMEQIQQNQLNLDRNQQQIVLAVNNWQSTLQNHEQRLDLNQQSINSILVSLNNQQTLLMAVFDELKKLQGVNSDNRGNNP